MPTRASDLFFAPFRLDAVSGRLWNGPSELAIRPKALAVLRHLAEHPGELVTAADLVHAVWADSAGSLPLVKGCIREVRKILGDDSVTPRFIATVGRRGYRFVAPIQATAAPAAAWSNGDEGTLFVGRGAELARLDAWLDAALAGTRQTVLLTGEAGIGKTTLTGQFLAAAASRHALRVARGHCVEHYGPGEPYLPVLQALAALGRGTGGERVLDVLERYAPTWLAQLPPLLAPELRARLRSRVAGTSRERMLREMCDAAAALGADRPLVLWLDDLHWSDPSTIALVSALAQGTEPARLLLVATYRPAEVVVSAHPLGPARQTLLASGHAHELALAVLSGTDVRGYLARRFPAHTLPEAFGTATLAITDGNPLFLSSLLDELVTTRVLVEEDGTWRLRQRVETLREIVPESLRHLIERQIERLSPNDQRLLEAGSVGGRELAAGAIAAALDLGDSDAVDERLYALARAGQLVEPHGLDAPPQRATSGRYAFVHALHQRVLYRRLSPARRARLHRRLAEAQETAWGDRSDEIAAELALHFERGGDARRAIRFLRVAAENAARRLAVPESIAYLTRALALVDRLTHRERTLVELQLQMALGLMRMNSGSSAAPEIDQTHRRAADLAARLANRPELYPMLRGLHRITLMRGDLARARTLARKGLAMARKSGDAGALLEAHVALGVSLFYAGELQPARTTLRKALRQRPAVPASSPSLQMLDPAVVIEAHLAFLAWLVAAEIEGTEPRGEMHRLAEAIGQPIALAYAQIAAGVLGYFRRDAEAMRAAAETVLGLNAVPGFSMFVAIARAAHGWVRAVDDGAEDGVDEIRASLAQWQATGARFMVPYLLGMLAESQAAFGHHADALATLATALAAVKHTGERWWEPELLRLTGAIRSDLARHTRGARRTREREAARAVLRRAATLARRRGATALAQRARESLDALD